MNKDLYLNTFDETINYIKKTSNIEKTILIQKLDCLIDFKVDEKSFLYAYEMIINSEPMTNEKTREILLNKLKLAYEKVNGKKYKVIKDIEPTKELHNVKIERSYFRYIQNRLDNILIS